MKLSIDISDKKKIICKLAGEKYNLMFLAGRMSF